MTAAQMLANTAAFTGMVNGVTVDELVQQIARYNSTIATLVATAQHLLIELGEDYAEAINIWANISVLEASIQEFNSTVTQSHLDAVESYLEYLDQQRANLRMNLTHISEVAMDLTEALTRLNSSVANASRDSGGTSTSFEVFRSQLDALRSHTDSVLELAKQLNASIETTREASQYLVENYTTIVVSLPMCLVQYGHL